jgi:flagellar FliL protein
MSAPEITEDAPATKKKGKKKLFVLLGALVVLGGGTAGGLYAAGMVGGAPADPHGDAAAGIEKPKLVPKTEQKRPGDGEGHGEGGGEVSGPSGQGGDKYASNYYSFSKDFTANIADSDRFIQVGLALSTPYDDRVIKNIKTNEIAVRSAVLLSLGDTTEDQIASEKGKQQLQLKLAKAINATLQQKEGFGGVSNVYFTNFVVQ